MTDQYHRVLDGVSSGVGPSDVGDSELRLLSNIFWAIRRAILWIVLLGFIVAFIAYCLTYTREVKYTSSAKVMIETRVQTETQFTPEVSGLPLSLTSLESELQLLRSTDLIEAVVDRLQLQSDPSLSSKQSLSPVSLLRDLKNRLVDLVMGGDQAAVRNADTRSEEDFLKENAIKKLLDARRIEQIGDISAVYQIRVTAKSPQEAAEISNAMAVEYLSLLTKMKRDDLEQAQDWLATRIGQLREDLIEQSSRLEAHSIEIPYSPDEYATIKAQRIKAERRARIVSDELLKIEDQSKTLDFLVEHGNADEAMEVAKQFGLLNIGQDNESSFDANLTETKLALASLNSEKSYLKSQLNELLLSIENFKKQQAQQVQHISATKRIENEILVTEAIYRDFVAQLGRRAEQRDYLDAGAHIIEKARVSVKPSEPKRSQAAITALVVFVIFGLLWTVIRELFQNRLRTRHEFESTAGIKLSGIIPELKNKAPFENFFRNGGILDSELEQYGKRLLASKGVGLRTFRSDDDFSSSLAVEFFSKNTNGVRSQRFTDDGCMILSGASALPGEGKTTSILALGSLCAKNDFRTLIIDCDTFSSTYNSLSTLTEKTIKHAAAQPLRFVDYIVQSPQERLDILPLVGLNNNEAPSTDMIEKFICSASFLNLLYALSDLYEVILLDTPPLLESVEAAYLSQISQHVIFFARWNSTKKNTVLQGMRELENAGVLPSALVATRVKMRKAKKYGDPII